MARTAADRPSTFSSANQPGQDQSNAGHSADGNRKRPSSALSMSTTPKTTRMEVDADTAGAKARLSKANQELFDLMTTYMDAKFEDLSGQMGNVQDEVIQNTNAIKILGDDVNKNKDDIEKLSSQVKDLRKEGGGTVDETRVEKIVERALDRLNEPQCSTDGARMEEMSKEIQEMKCGRGSMDFGGESTGLPDVGLGAGLLVAGREKR